MRTIDIQRYSMLVRVREFGAAHRALFPTAGTAGQLFAAVSKAADQLNACMVTEASVQGATREGARAKAAARRALWEALNAITRTARALETPGLGGKFRMSSVRNDHELATAAGLFARDAAPLTPQFLAHGLPKTFLTDLEAALEAFERATQDRFAAREIQAAAKANIGVAIEAALRALIRLDAIVANTLRDQPPLLATWNRARRVAKARARAAARDAQPADPKAATPGAAPSTAPDAGAGA